MQLPGKVNFRTAIIINVVNVFLLLLFTYGLYLYYTVPFETAPFTDRNIRESKEAVAKDRNQAQTHVDLGWAYFQKYLGSQDASLLNLAQSEYEQALALDSGNLAAKYNLGLVLLEKGQDDAAMGRLQEIIREYPRHNLAHFLLGQLYERKGMIDEAISEYRATLQISPGSANVYADLAAAYEKKGLREEAIAAYRSALKYDPGNGKAGEALARLGVKN